MFCYRDKKKSRKKKKKKKQRRGITEFFHKPLLFLDHSNCW